MTTTVKIVGFIILIIVVQAIINKFEDIGWRKKAKLDKKKWQIEKIRLAKFGIGKDTETTKGILDDVIKSLEDKQNFGYEPKGIKFDVEPPNKEL